MMPNASTMTKPDPNHRCCGSTHKELWNGCSALLVPLMIAVFTITTTMLQMNATKQINEQNLKIATDNRDIANYTRHQQLEIEEGRLQREHEYQNRRSESEKTIAQENRNQDLQIANQTRLQQIAIEEARLKQERQIEDERRAADFRAAENRQMDTILATYLMEMGEFLLTENFTLQNRRLATVIRAKTLAVLRQLDEKRKSYLVQFLYEAELLIHNRNPLDLSGADLQYIDLSGRKLGNISLSGAVLDNANFTRATLDNSNFNHAQLTGASFSACQAFNSNFSSAKLVNCNSYKGNFSNGIFDRCDASESNFTGADLTSATFVQAHLTKTTCCEIQGHSTLFDQAVLDDADFDSAYLVQANFRSASMRGTSFKSTKLSSTNWRNSTVLGADFRKAQLRGANINKQQLRQTFSFENAVFSDRTTVSKTNLLVTGDAERKTRAGCSMTNWKSDKSMVARAYSFGKVPTVLGACYFTGLENEVLATMYQRVNIINSTEIAGENRRLWLYGRCRRLIPDNEFFPVLRLREFNHANHSLKNYTWTLNPRDEQFNDEKAFYCNSATIQVELEITFKRKLSALSNETFGYCDNLRLAIYDDTYS